MTSEQAADLLSKLDIIINGLVWACFGLGLLIGAVWSIALVWAYHQKRM